MPKQFVSEPDSGSPGVRANTSEQERLKQISMVPPTILVVDDNDASRYAMSRVIQSAGFNVLDAVTGQAGLELAEKVDLVVLDVHLPDINGYEVCRRIRLSPTTCHLPVIQVSSVYMESADKAEGFYSGADGYLTHPIDPPVLLGTVKAFLRVRRAEEEMRRSMAALEALAQRQHLILQNIPDYAIFQSDADGRITEWTPGADRVMGWPAHEILGQHVSIFYTPEHVAAGLVEQELSEAAEKGRAEREDWRVRKGGERFWCNEIATALRDGKGTLVGFTTISRDLSERRGIEEALRETQERYRLILDHARDYAIFMLDPQGRVVTWNSGAERVFGYTDAEMRGRDSSILFTPEDAARGEHLKELSTAAGKSGASEDRWQMRRGGERFFANSITTPLRNAAGTLDGFVKVCRDMTEMRELQEQRERLFEQEKIARLEAERAMVMRDEFLAVVSHELRTPLTSILLWIKMLRSGTVRGEVAARAMENVEISAEAQRQLIEDLLDVSAAISGKLQLNVRDTEVGPLIQNAVDALQPMAQAKGVNIEVDLDAHTNSIRADPGRLQQVVWNLVNNAVKFTPKNGQVRVTVQRLAQSLQIQVADTGRGISAKFLPNVFERFRQADASITRQHGGLGLGLAICRQLIELHGGNIHAESAGEGQGTTLTVNLPQREMQSEPWSAGDEGGIAYKAPRSAATTRLRGVRVLLVEDEECTRTAIKQLLERCQAEVTEAESTAQAIAAFGAGLGGVHPYDVLVSDLGMPVRDGYELILEIRRLEQQCGGTTLMPAIALSAYAREEDRTRTAAAGFQQHLTKPVEPDALVTAIANVIRRTL